MDFVVVQSAPKPKKRDKPFVVIDATGNGTRLIHARNGQKAIAEFCGDIAWTGFEQRCWKCIEVPRA